MLKQIAIPFSRGSSWPRDWTRVFCIVGRFFTIGATREAHGFSLWNVTCREPAWESPPTTRPCGRVLVGKVSQNSRGAPLGLPERLPQNQNLFYYFMTFTNSSDINGGLSPTTFLCKKINLKLYLIILLGIIGVFQFKPLWWHSSLPDMIVQIHSLPTTRGTGSLRYSNNAELLRELKFLK